MRAKLSRDTTDGRSCCLIQKCYRGSCGCRGRSFRLHLLRFHRGFLSKSFVSRRPSEYHQVRHFPPPFLETPLQCSKLTARINIGVSVRRRANSSADVRHGSASNQARRSAATRANGSGVLRFFLVAGAFRRAVGRTSPSLHAVRKLDRNCSSVGCSIANATSGASAISTSRLCPARMSLSKWTGSRVSNWALTCRFISSVALASAMSRWYGVAGG